MHIVNLGVLKFRISSGLKKIALIYSAHDFSVHEYVQVD